MPSGVGTYFLLIQSRPPKRLASIQSSPLHDCTVFFFTEYVVISTMKRFTRMHSTSGVVSSTSFLVHVVSRPQHSHCRWNTSSSLLESSKCCRLCAGEEVSPFGSCTVKQFEKSEGASFRSWHSMHYKLKNGGCPNSHFIMGRKHEHLVDGKERSEKVVYHGEEFIAV